MYSISKFKNPKIKQKLNDYLIEKRNLSIEEYFEQLKIMNQELKNL